MKKEDITSLYEWVGRIRKGVADEAGIKFADVFIDESHLEHIKEKHQSELKALGISARFLVEIVLDNYNRIYQGSGKSILWVCFDEKVKSHLTAALTLNYIVKKGFGEVRTAQPRSSDNLKKKKSDLEKEKENTVIPPAVSYSRLIHGNLICVVLLMIRQHSQWTNTIRILYAQI